MNLFPLCPLLCLGFLAPATATRSPTARQCERQALDDTFAALQVHKVVSSGRERTPKPNAHRVSKPEWNGIQLVNAGLSRTGTESICRALKQLGHVCSHGERFKFPGTPQEDSIAHAVKGDPSAMLKFLEEGNVSVVMDGPLNQFAGLFQKKYGSKVLLSLHPHGASGWVNSVIKFVRWWPLGSSYQTPKFFTPMGPGCTFPVAPDARLSNSMRKICMQAYDDYNNKVIAAIPKTNLLLYNVTSGWAPLCNFLEKPVPENAQFPFFDNVVQRKNRVAKCGVTPDCIETIDGRLPIPGDEKLIPTSDGPY